MQKYIALLRGINVGGRGIVRMADLKAAFVAVGCEGVATYIQSGNVIFAARTADLPVVGRKLRPKLRALIGAEAVVLFRSHGDLEEAVRRVPIKANADDPEAKLYVSFLSRPPRRKVAFPLISAAAALEVSRLGEAEVFVVSRKKNGRYGFPNNFVEQQFGVPATTRNWATVTELLNLSS